MHSAKISSQPAGYSHSVKIWTKSVRKLAKLSLIMKNVIVLKAIVSTFAKQKTTKQTSNMQ